VVKEMVAKAKVDNGGWEKVSHEDDTMGHDDPHNISAGDLEGSSGREGDEDGGLAKRVTRSAGKKSSFESLE
jgi:hypothetical protein